jgi:hypothetical protein
MVDGCGKEYQNRAGLSSHLSMAHNLNAKGEPLPKGLIEERKKKLSTAISRRVLIPSGVTAAPATPPPAHAAPSDAEKTAWPSPEAREKVRATKAAKLKKKKALREELGDQVPIAVGAGGTNYYKKLAERGIHRCPECSKESHKSIDFVTATELGKHRRFRHGILGRYAAKTALQVERRQEERAVKTVAPAKADDNKCPQCLGVFKNAQGLRIHLYRAHKPEQSSAIVPVTPQEINNANGSTQGTVHATATRTQNGRGHIDDASYATTVAVANLTGKLESIILTASVEYDLPPRQLARRCILALSEHYST